MEAATYWLEDLLEEHRIRSMEDAFAVLSDDDRLRKICTRYANVASEADPLPSNTGETIVAGAALDLSGSLDCLHPECMRRRVDDLFGRVWHYFDTVVVTGASCVGLDDALDRPDDLRGYLYPHIENLLYLQETGARDLMTFRERPHYCIHQIPEVAQKVGISQIDELRAQFVESAMQGRVSDFKPLWDERGHWRVLVKRPWGGIDEVGVRLPSSAETDEIFREAAQGEFHTIADHFAGDLMRAKAYGAPLAVHNELHGDWLQAQTTVTESDVALSMRLPVLSDASPRDIAQVRREESASFAAFKTALKEAIRERVSNSAEGDTSKKIAQQITEDIVQPALNDIERTLGAARRTMLRKSSARAGLATVGVTAGLLTGVPGVLASGLGIALGATSLLPLDAFFDKKQEIEMRDMYFLWKAQARLPRV